ncbi:MAG: hypothetical protein J6M08_04665 [Methanobrevibacter sp.]|nr:hypothetical protein [Methanobrevibacter sp.]
MESIELSEISLTSSATVSLAALTADIEKITRTKNRTIAKYLIFNFSTP